MSVSSIRIANNVAVPVLGRDFWIVELEGAEVKVEAEPAEPVAGPH